MRIKKLNQRISDLSNGVAWAFVMAVVAIILSVIAMAQVYPRHETSFDYLGAMVSALAFITAVLIGWQIAQTILSREKLRNIDDTIQQKTEHAIHFNMYHIFLLQGKDAENRSEHPLALEYYIRCLYCTTKGEFSQDAIKETLSAISRVQKEDALKINPKDCEEYKKTLSLIDIDGIKDIINELDKHSDDSMPSRINNSGWLMPAWSDNKTSTSWH